MRTCDIHFKPQKFHEKDNVVRDQLITYSFFVLFVGLNPSKSSNNLCPGSGGIDC